MSGLTLLSFACDIALWFFVLRRNFHLRPARRGVCALLIPMLALYSLGRLHLITSPVAEWLDVAMMPASILVCFLAAYGWVGMDPKCSLLTAMTFCIAVHVGRRTHYYVLLPLMGSLFSEWGQPLAMGALKALFVLLLMSGQEQPEEQDIAPRHLIPLGFAVFVCLAMDVGSLSQGSNAGVTLACYLSAFLLAFLERRAITQDAQLQRLRAIESNMRLQYDLARQQLRDEAMIRRMVHDLKHQLAALEAGTHREEALRELRDSLERVRPVSYSDSPVLNAILNQHIRLAGEQGIDMRVESRFGVFPMLSELEVSTLFSNALTNALEAATLSRGKWIRCRYNETPDFAVVVLQNASPEVKRDAGGHMISSKGGEMHGIGLTSMESIARGCGGSMRADAQDGVFTLTLMLPKDSGT